MASSSFIWTVAAAIGLLTVLGTILLMFYRKTKYHHENKETDSPSSSSASSIQSSAKIHDVFPSFRGEDVRKDFLSHIQKEFQRKGITAFIDNNIKRGEFISPELSRAIRGSKIAIILLSKNYASSSWCLDELVEIMKCREELRQKVIVVFYKVDPSHVKKLTGDFGKVFRNTCKGKKTENIKRWREAFAKVATIAGYDSSTWGNEAEMIEKIVGDISNMLYRSTPSRDFDCLIGMGAHMENMERLLCLESDEVRMIGIWGPSGIGKTTIARYLFHKHSANFDLSVFMENIKFMYTRQACSDDYSLKLLLHQQLISRIFKQKNIEIPHLGIAQDRLQDKRVLVVLDDVDHSVQLDAMAKETRWFGPGSRIVITTQDRKLLKAHDEIKDIYKVELPTPKEALQIFCMNAFGQNAPKDGFEELAREVTRLAGELPLGLKVMGSYFKGMRKEEWIEAMPRLRTHLHSDIQSVLEFSYDALDNEDKDLFLHLACFFRRERIEIVERCLEKNFTNVRQGLRLLTEKSLISIDDFYYPKFVEMHNLLVQLGREIVRKQCIDDPGKRRFLVDEEEIREVLTDDTGSRSVLGIDYLSFNGDELNISEKAINGLSNLQFLRISCYDSSEVQIPPGLNNLSRRLRFLDWRYYPLKSLPSEFHTEFLVKLDMQNSKLEKLWEGIQPLKNLVWMDLSFSKDLKELPDLSTATNLQELMLYECSSMVKLPSSIGNATSLVTLNLRFCSKLKALPTNINLQSLEELNLIGCSSLKTIPQISTNIEYLSIEGTAIEEVTSSLIMPRLDVLDISNCENCKEFPHAFANITELQLRGEETQELPPWIKRFSCLRKLIVIECRKLVSLRHIPDSLKEIYTDNCESLETLDWSSHNSEFDILNFANCFKLNKEARDLIIKTSTRDYAVLPGREVPVYFTHRAIGDSVTVNLNGGRSFPTPFRFKVCIFLAGKMKDWGARSIYLRIMNKHNGLTVMLTQRDMDVYSSSELGHRLCIFEVEAEIEVSSTELVFEFKLADEYFWEVKECGVKVQLMEHDESDQEAYQESEDGNESDEDSDDGGQSDLGHEDGRRLRSRH